MSSRSPRGRWVGASRTRGNRVFVSSDWGAMATGGIFVLALILILGPVIALAVISSQIATSAARDAAERAVVGAASASGIAVSEQMRGLSDVVESYSTRKAVREAMSTPVDLPTLGVSLGELSALRGDIAVAFATDEAGTLAAVIPNTPSIVGESFAFRDWYRGAMTKRSVYISDAYETAAFGHALVVVAAAPIFDVVDDESIVGVMVAGYDLAAIQRRVDEYSQAQHVSITITDKHGTVVARTGAAPKVLAPVVGLERAARVAAALEGGSGSGVAQDSDTTVVYAYAPVPTLGWTVIATIPTKDAFSSANTVSTNIAAATVLIGAIVAVGLTFVVFQQRRRQQVDASLRHTTALVSAIVENIPHAISVSDADLRFVQVNKAAERLLGVPADKLVGRTVNELSDVLPQGFSWDDDAEILDAGVASEAGARTITTGDGTERVIYTRKIPLSQGDDDEKILLRISEDITERVQADRTVREAQRAAEDANRAKSEFLSRMSHELRTPLNAVIGFAQLLEQDSLEPEQRDSARHIRHGGEHLLSLINEVLDISLMETGRMRVSLEPVALGDVIDEALSLVGSLARSRSIHMPPGHRPECEIYVRGDRQRLKQVLLNLLTNAVKYNRDQGTVEVTCHPRPDGRVRVSVTDSGSGIAPDKLDLVFAPFERLGAEASEVEGTGLGLALSRGLVAAMGGEIGVDSEPGKGATFWLELERATPPTVDVPVDITPIPRRQAAGVTGIEKTVLYIEDNLSNIKLLERIFASTPQYELVVAMHGELGLDLAKSRRPDLVLLDLNLPDMGGREILARLRAEPASRSVPVIIVSADATSDQIRRLLSAGATDYLTKPINVSDFRRTVTFHLHAGEVGGQSVDVARPEPGGTEPRSGQTQAEGIASDLRVLRDGAVNDLRELFTESADIDDFLATLDGELTARSQALHEAIVSADTGGVRSTAHALRGALGSIGATQASALSASLEHDPARSRDALTEAEIQLLDLIAQARSEIHARLRDDR